MSEINYTCSVGQLCHSSQLLKRNQLKKCSYPFDWIYCNLDVIIDCLETDFKIFLDKSHYINRSPFQCLHTKYGVPGLNNLFFNHHNPLMHIHHYNYFERCVNRFRELLLKPERKLFINMHINMEPNSMIDIKNQVINFNNKFSNYTNNYTLLVILHFANKPNRFHYLSIDNNIHFLELHTVSASGGINFNDNNDNIYLDNLLTNMYQYNVKST